MSTALAVAAATEAMRKLLENWLRDTNVNAVLESNPTVSSLPPDQIDVRGPNAQVGLNLFLHRITLNQGWRNEQLPSRDSVGQRVASPPLPVDLHFVLSGYGRRQLQPETLLGHGMQAFHRNPVITRNQLKTLLADNLAGTGLAAQVEQLRISPESIAGQEASELWSSFQATYRPSFYYWVSVVLIDDAAPVNSPLPVLTRGQRLPSGYEEGVSVGAGLAPRYPVLTALTPQNKQPVAVTGGQVTVEGELLTGARRVRLVDHRLDRTVNINIPLPEHSQRFTFTVPANVAVGTYDLTVEVRRTNTSPVQITNRLPLSVAPRLTNLPLTVGRVAGTATVEVECAPSVHAGQPVSLILGTREIAAKAPIAATDTLSFRVTKAQAGSYLARLRVDGIESILINRATTPPSFDAAMTVTIQ